ncbi:hypothetical protein [Luteolibacter luteus]|uniref:Uncharacterized protein n=1 Tax=Luteolibacter luteus TaxID=2728835 RepID=A0A858RLA4_9BACT|nr:hypothetical protein [Luteolibacter luteus]QJE97727.1 hypothetical protein HHL09_18710 [Luteolibacter luteus]
MRPCFIFVFAWLAFLQASEAEDARKGGIGPEVLPPGALAPTADLPNDEALAARREAGGTVSPKIVPRKEKGYGLAEFSQFLSFGETGTILPKGSVLYYPDAHSIRLISGASKTMLSWPDFLTANRSWLATHEVSLAQVKGEAPISESDRASFKAGGKMVVATLRNNPVTVLIKPSTTPSKP